MGLLLKNISWSVEGKVKTADVRIRKELITEIGDLSVGKKDRAIDFRNHFLYPGLINSHDHLDMNLYPHMGNPPYNNYTEWAHDIYKPQESPVKEIQRVDIADRLLWGGIKNLISGATTVVHHNPWHWVLSKKEFPVHVIKTSWAHSLALEKRVVGKFPWRKVPFVIHAAEGVDELAHNEIKGLDVLGLLRKNTILIHSIAVTETDIELIQEKDASVVWCPSSNLWMFNTTAPVAKMKGKVKVAIGTDSTMTGPPTLFDEMRTARNTGLATKEEVYEMVTSVPAKIYQIEKPEIKVGARANFCISPMIKEDYLENLFQLNPSSLTGVFLSGELRFGDPDLATTLELDGHQINVMGIKKWIAYELVELQRRIKSIAGNSCETNSIWKMIA